MLRNAFWVVSLLVLGVYAFFVALGAWDPGEVLPLTIAMGVLVVLWTGHVWIRRRTPQERDPRLIHARERRGF